MEQIKHRVAHYWSHRAEGFETQRLREFESEKKDRWLAEFRKYLPQGCSGVITFSIKGLCSGRAGS